MQLLALANTFLHWLRSGWPWCESVFNSFAAGDLGANVSSQASQMLTLVQTFSRRLRSGGVNVFSQQSAMAWCKHVFTRFAVADHCANMFSLATERLALERMCLHLSSQASQRLALVRMCLRWLRSCWPLRKHINGTRCGWSWCGCDFTGFAAAFPGARMISQASPLLTVAQT